MPAFALLLPVQVAVASTAAVHAASNLSRVALPAVRARRDVMVRFGLSPATCLDGELSASRTDVPGDILPPGHGELMPGGCRLRPEMLHGRQVARSGRRMPAAIGDEPGGEMAKAELKTKPTKQTVSAFIGAIEDPARRKECRAVAALMKKVTKASPKMWGGAIVGFGDIHLKYASGRELDWFKVGFSPRKQSLTLYLMPGSEKYAELLARLGKVKAGKGCVYVNRLEDIDVGVLERLVRESAVQAEKHRGR